MLKVGRQYLDPLNRVVTLIKTDSNGFVVVKLAGPYGATVCYPSFCLQALPEELT